MSTERRCNICGKQSCLPRSSDTCLRCKAVKTWADETSTIPEEAWDSIHESMALFPEREVMQMTPKKPRGELPDTSFTHNTLEAKGIEYTVLSRDLATWKLGRWSVSRGRKGSYALRRDSEHVCFIDSDLISILKAVDIDIKSREREYRNQGEN